MNLLRRHKGITLIALVITIIVLLILAGVTIAMVVGDNGILKRSNEAKDETTIAKIQEEVDLAVADLVIEYQTRNYVTSNSNSDDQVKAMDEILVAVNESDVTPSPILDEENDEENNEEPGLNSGSESDVTNPSLISGSESDYISDGSDENITPGTAGAYVAEQEARLESKLGYEISFTGRKITVVDRDSGLETSGVMEDSGRIVWNGKYVAGSGANSSGNNLPDMSNVEEYITAKLATDNPIIEVSYNPQGSYSWNKELATSDQTGTDTLSSATGGSFNVNTWRVLDINTTTGTVRLVPKNYASGTVRFQGAQGYNNAVKLLNDACSALYSDSDAGATARSINMNDIEDIMDDNITLPTEATAPTQPYSAYSSSNSNYPVIYGNENLAVINGDDAISNGLGLSQQTSFIQRSEGTSATSKIGAITTATSIRPYKTYYSKNNSSFTTALGNKSGIILPNGSSTNYWVASRCVDTYSSFCDFDVCRVSSGSLDASGMFNSYGSTYHNSRALFPVVSLSSGHLTANAAGTGYTVE